MKTCDDVKDHEKKSLHVIEGNISGYGTISLDQGSVGTVLYLETHSLQVQCCSERQLMQGSLLVELSLFYGTTNN